MTDSDNTTDMVVIERRFDAPVALVWRMWTDPRHFAAWYGPVGAEITVSTMDVRVGGTRLVGMAMPNGPGRMWFTGQYREIVEHELLVYTESVCDENGQVLTPADIGMPIDYPVTTEVRVQLEDIGGRTLMVMTHTGIPADSPGATGWTMALDKLAGYVESRLAH